MAVTGTFLATGFFYAPPVPLSPPLAILSVVLIIVSAGLGIVTINALGNLLHMPEARELVTGGPYRIVRQSLYVVEAIGVTSLLNPAFRLAGAGALCGIFGGASDAGLFRRAGVVAGFSAIPRIRRQDGALHPVCVVNSSHQRERACRPGASAEGAIQTRYSPGSMVFFKSWPRKARSVPESVKLTRWRLAG